MATILVNYESGNLHSVEKAFYKMAQEYDAGDVRVSANPDEIAQADRLILPGDGAFPACKNALFDHTGIYEAIHHVAQEKGNPFLGICVGMQLLADQGHEYEITQGLGWIAGDVVPITPSDPTQKVPHMGWNDLCICQSHPIFEGITTGQHVYFIHSYKFLPQNSENLLAYASYGTQITALIGKDNLLGMQFHPEKSHHTGLQMIANFLRWKP